MLIDPETNQVRATRRTQAPQGGAPGTATTLVVDSRTQVVAVPETDLTLIRQACARNHLPTDCLDLTVATGGAANGTPSTGTGSGSPT